MEASAVPTQEHLPTPVHSQPATPARWRRDRLGSPASPQLLPAKLPEERKEKKKKRKKKS